jgi:hypothetical protein
MSLSSLKKLKKATVVDFVADLSAYADEGEEVKIKFRRPKAPDYFPPASLRKGLLIAFPELNNADATLVNYILVMALCYVSDAGDPQGSEPWRAIAQMARDSSEALLDLIRQFGEAFPADVSEARQEAKND